MAVRWEGVSPTPFLAAKFWLFCVKLLLCYNVSIVLFRKRKYNFSDEHTIYENTVSEKCSTNLFYLSWRAYLSLGCLAMVNIPLGKSVP